MTMTALTHEQAMCCFNCALAGFVPPEHFPQVSGLWDRPCPQCGVNAVWVTEPRPLSSTVNGPSPDSKEETEGGN